MKTMFLLLVRPLKIFIFFHSVQSSEWCLGGKPSPQRQRAHPSPPLYLRYCLDRRPSVFANLPLTVPNSDGGRPPKNSSRLTAPPCNMQMLLQPGRRHIARGCFRALSGIYCRQSSGCIWPWYERVDWWLAGEVGKLMGGHGPTSPRYIGRGRVGQRWWSDRQF